MLAHAGNFSVTDTAGGCSTSASMIPVQIQFYAVAHEHPCLVHHEKSSQPATDFQTSSRNFGEGCNMQELTPEALPSVACGAYWCTLHGSLERLQDSAHQVGIFESWRLGDRACGRATAACPSDRRRLPQVIAAKAAFLGWWTRRSEAPCYCAETPCYSAEAPCCRPSGRRRNAVDIA